MEINIILKNHSGYHFTARTPVMVLAVLVSVRTQHHWTPQKACKEQTNPTGKHTAIPILLTLFSHTNTKLVKYQVTPSYKNKLK